MLSITETTDGTDFDTLEYTLKVKCITNKSQPKDSYRAEDLYENHCGMQLICLYFTDTICKVFCFLLNKVK